MRTIEINLYQFKELSEEAKQKALEAQAYINVEHFEWWEATYEDAKNIGLKLEGFELDRGKHATGELEDNSRETMQAIQENHGKDCATFKLAEKFEKDYDNLVGEHASEEEPERVAEDKEEEFDPKCDELEEQFLKDILSAYADILEKDYEYRMSKEAIIETIEANEYDFTEDGKLYS